MSELSYVLQQALTSTCVYPIYIYVLSRNLNPCRWGVLASRYWRSRSPQVLPVIAKLIGAAVGRLSRTERGLPDGWRRLGRFAQSSPLAASCTTLQRTAIFWPSRHVIRCIPRSARVRDARLAEPARRWRVRQRGGQRVWVSSFACVRRSFSHVQTCKDVCQYVHACQEREPIHVSMSRI